MSSRLQSRGSCGVWSHDVVSAQRINKPSARCRTSLNWALRGLLISLQRVQLSSTALPLSQPSPTTDQYVLFFDGGSRGNPGVAGSGSVIVRVDAHGNSPTILWAAAMSLAHASTTPGPLPQRLVPAPVTNNQAEYTGLLTGLKYAATARLKPLTVIGDSLMIITQLKTSRAPRNDRLRDYYGQARVLADTIGVTRWCHHVRAFNKMADCAANLAMDSACSVQTTMPNTRPFWAELETHLQEDVAEWQVSTYPDHASTG